MGRRPGRLCDLQKLLCRFKIIQMVSHEPMQSRQWLGLALMLVEQLNERGGLIEFILAEFAANELDQRLRDLLVLVWSRRVIRDGRFGEAAAK